MSYSFWNKEVDMAKSLWQKQQEMKAKAEAEAALETGNSPLRIQIGQFRAFLKVMDVGQEFVWPGVKSTGIPTSIVWSMGLKSKKFSFRMVKVKGEPVVVCKRVE